MDGSTLRLFWHKYRRAASSGTVALLMFAVGWHLGRVTSPYYAAHPIIFQDNTSASLDGSRNELSKLQRASQPAESAQPSSAAVAGATADAPSPAASPTIAAAAQFVASKNSSLFHHISCPAASRIKEENKRFFASTDEARAAGLSPSKCSQELGY